MAALRGSLSLCALVSYNICVCLHRKSLLLLLLVALSSALIGYMFAHHRHQLLISAKSEVKAVLLVGSKDNRDGGWGPRQLTRISNDYSETGSKTLGIQSLLGFKQNGVFLEAGAFNGEVSSVSLGLELHHNWTGILVEPVPWLFGQLVAKRRRAFHVQGCISPTGKANLTEFIVDSTTYTGSGTVTGRYKYAAPVAKASKLVTMYIMCYPLMDIVQAAGYKKLDVLYLDVQGAELDIIKTIRFDELDITLIGMEYSQDTRELAIQKALAVLAPQGFKYLGVLGIVGTGNDLIFGRGLNGLLGSE